MAISLKSLFHNLKYENQMDRQIFFCVQKFKIINPISFNNLEMWSQNIDVFLYYSYTIKG